MPENPNDGRVPVPAPAPKPSAAPDALASMAAEVDAGLGPVPGEGGAPGQPALDEVRELAGALELVAVMVRQLKPALAPVWTPAAMESIARAAVPVVNKYGWTVGGLFAKWGPELALAAAAAPVALGTAKVIADERAAAPAPGVAELPKPEPKPEPRPEPAPAIDRDALMPQGGAPMLGIPPAV